MIGNVEVGALPSVTPVGGNFQTLNNTCTTLLTMVISHNLLQRGFEIFSEIEHVVKCLH